jgi:membrane dipeptidase
MVKGDHIMLNLQGSTPLHKESIIIDGRDPTHLMYMATRNPKPEYIDVLNAGGLTASVVDAAWVDDDFGAAARAVAAWHRRVVSLGNKARIVYHVDDIREAKRLNQVGFILSYQSPSPVENDVDLAYMWQKLGIRVMELTYQTRNLVGDGCTEKTDCGLSRFGENLIRHLNKCGIVVDLSHAGNRTALEGARASAKPVILSHTNARALCDTPRNATDELLKEVAKGGGVVGVSAYSAIVIKGGGETGTTLPQFLNHIDYLLELLGEDHVAIGLDVGEFRSPTELDLLHGLVGGAGNAPKHRYVEELKTRTGTPKLTAGLVERGYSDVTIKKILGENFLRVFEQVWEE